MSRSTALLLFGSTVASVAAIALAETPVTFARSQPMLFGATAAEEPAPYIAAAAPPARWQAQALDVQLDASLDELGPGARDAVLASFGSWFDSDADLPRVTFTGSRGVSPAVRLDGQNTILYAPIALPGHERELAITLMYSDAKTGRILEADVIINSDFRFGVLSGDGHCDRSLYDLQNVMTHEVGHFFGLGENAEHRHATMYASTDVCELHKRALSADDAMALAELYGKRSASLELLPAGATASLGRHAIHD